VPFASAGGDTAAEAGAAAAAAASDAGAGTGAGAGAGAGGGGSGVGRGGVLRASSGSDPAGSGCGGFGAPSSASIGRGAGAGAPIGGWGGVGLAVATRRKRAREAWGRRKGEGERGHEASCRWGNGVSFKIRAWQLDGPDRRFSPRIRFGFPSRPFRPGLFPVIKRD